MKNDPLVKDIVNQVGKIVDARLKTNNVLIIGQVKAEIKAAEARIRKDMATKDDIKDMVKQSDIKDMVRKSDIENMATKDDIKRLEEKFDKNAKANNKRFEIIEEELNIPRTNKN